MTIMNYSRLIIYITVAALAGACSESFLELNPQGELSGSAILASEDGVDGILISAYSVLNGQIGSATNAYNAPASNWTFGDIVSDDAYKGSSGVSDQEGMHLMEIFQANPTITDVSKKWNALYEGISRSNAAIRAIQGFEGWSEETKNQKTGEARFLRAHYYFDLKKIYNKIPYIDETVTSQQEMKNISNEDLNSEQLWAKIAGDFEYAASVLPDEQKEIGRITRGAANAYLAKAYIFQGKWDLVIEACDKVINSPYGYELLSSYPDVFHPDFQNSRESVFEIQYSINDGAATNGFNGNIGDRLNQIGGPYPRLYGFHRPSQNLVNAHKTNGSGLPLFTTYNDRDLGDNDNVDPRLDFTVGRPGIPFLDAGIYVEAWNRGNNTYGPFANKKVMVPVGYGDRLEVFPYTNANNYAVIRYADVLLWKAEALVELDRLEEARGIVNRIRSRAKNSNYVQYEGSDAANYVIEEYSSTWTDKQYARNAVRMERRVEFALEGHRFFDLVRWNIAEQRMNDYIDREKLKRIYLESAQFQAGINEFFPIPQEEIDLSGGILKQNTGY
jgi:hypothetical protein